MNELWKKVGAQVIGFAVIAIIVNAVATWLSVHDMAVWKDQVHPLETEFAHQEIRTIIQSSDYQISMLEADVMLLEMRLSDLE